MTPPPVPDRAHGSAGAGPVQGRLNCLVAEHCWDPVGLAIVECGYLFERLRADASGRG
jgi:hypothetical protein